MKRGPGPRVGALWRDHRFVTYWAGQTVSELGDRVSQLALPLIAVTMLHASAMSVGLLTAAVWGPNVISLFVGAWVDRCLSKRRLLVAADVVRAVAILTLPIAHFLGEVTMAQLYAVALVTGAGGVLYQTAYPTFFTQLVRQGQYLEANSMLSTTRAASFVAGPTLAGALIQVMTAPLAMLVDAVSFLLSALAIGSVRVEQATLEPTDSREVLWHRATLGIRFLMGHAYLRASLACATTLNFFSFIVAGVLVLFASRTLGLRAGEIGLAFGIGAIGGLLGAALARPVARWVGVGITIAIGAIAFCAPFALIPHASGATPTKIVVLAAAEFISAAGIMLFDINLNSLQTAVTPDHMRSRVAGARATVNYGIRPLGAALGGVAAGTVGVGPTITVAAIGGTLSFLWLLRSPIITTRTIEELSAPGVLGVETGADN